MDDEKRCRGVPYFYKLYIFTRARTFIYYSIFYKSYENRVHPYTPTPVHSLSFLFDKAVAIGVEQFFEVSYLALQVFTFVCIGYQHPVGTHLYDLRG